MTNNDQLSSLIYEGYEVVSPRAIYGRSSKLCDGNPVMEGSFVEGSTEELFGTASSLGECEAVEALIPSLSEGALFHLLVATTLIVYLFMLYRSGGFIGAIWEGVFSSRHSEHRMANEGGALPLSRFKLTATLIGIASTALIAVRLTENAIDHNAPIYDSAWADYAPIVGLLLIGVIIAWNYAFHKIVEWLTYSDFMTTLSATEHMNFVRSIVILYPLIAVWLVADQGLYEVVSILLLIGGALTLLIFLKDTFILFIGKNISIFYWILYLCTAILLPLSFFAALLPDKIG